MSDQRPAGRPSKLTPAVHDAIVDAIKVGVTYEIAAQAAGVDVATVRRWMARGEAALEFTARGDDPFDPDRARAEEPFARFCAAVKDARAEAEVRALQTIRAHGRESWQAEAWFLERTRPERYRRREVVESVDAGPALDLSRLSPDELERLEALMEKATPEEDA